MPNDKPQTPVNVGTMRHVYRDIIAASAAGEGMFQVLASIPPFLRIDVCAIAWTGVNHAPVAIRREGSWGRRAMDMPAAGQIGWMHFTRGSAMDKIINTEYAAYYPDAQRNYSSIKEQGHDAYKLVIGNRLISIVFDPESPFTRMRQQINSLLDMVTQALLDFMHRQIRHYQDQIAFYLSQTESMGLDSSHGGPESDMASIMGEWSEATLQAKEIMDRNARLLASFFDIVKVQYLLAPDISKLVLFRQVLDTESHNGKIFHLVNFPVGPFSREGGSETLKVLEFPMQWGSNNEDDKFLIRIYSYRDMNDHVRKALMLGQVLIKCKEQVETLFDRRYREYRIYQDNRHFARCKTVRNEAAGFRTIMQYLQDSVADYEENARTLPRGVVFPKYNEYKDKIASVIKNTESEILEFRDEIRLKDLREYNYLNMKVPLELRKLLINAMDPGVYILVESEHPVLSRMSNLPDHTDEEVYEKKQVFVNNAATISVLYPQQLHFRFNRLRGKFLEFLESVGEGIGRLFAFINTQTGIKNRLALVQSLEFLVKQVSYSNQVVLEVSSLDISSFKIFNELFGHPFGDRIIKYTAHSLDECSPGYAFHVSGDEYYVVHCYHQETNEAWMKEFFASREILPETVCAHYKKKLQQFSVGIPLELPLVDVHRPSESSEKKLGTYHLTDFIGNFFTKDSRGEIALKQYSRTGNDYHKVVKDPNGEIQKLVDITWEALQRGEISLNEESFVDFVLSHNTLGSVLYVVPSMTIGTVLYNWENILPYVSDIIDAADMEAGKNKK